MDNEQIHLSQILLRQLNPSYRMVENIINICPKSLWAQRNIDPPIWQQIYHALYGLDYWFSASKAAFSPPQFDSEVNSVLGEPTKGFIEQDDLIRYMKFVESKTGHFINNLSESDITAPSPIYPKWSNLDVILEQARHFQHHIGYLNRVLLKCKLAPVEWEMYEGS